MEKINYKVCHTFSYWIFVIKLLLLLLLACQSSVSCSLSWLNCTLLFLLIISHSHSLSLSVSNSNSFSLSSYLSISVSIYLRLQKSSFCIIDLIYPDLTHLYNSLSFFSLCSSPNVLLFLLSSIVYLNHPTLLFPIISLDPVSFSLTSSHLIFIYLTSSSSIPRCLPLSHLILLYLILFRPTQRQQQEPPNMSGFYEGFGKSCR